jgi:adenylate cyclase
MKKKVFKAALFGNIFVVVLSLLVFLSGSFAVLERGLYDFNMKASMSHMPHEDIIVVNIDQNSLDFIDSRFPWPRDIYIPLLKNMSQAKVIGFDITFGEQSPDPAIDKAFADELAKHDNVIIPSTVEMESFFNRVTTIKKGELVKGKELYKPTDVIAAVSETAHINAMLEDDGAVRRTWLKLDTPDDGVIPSLAYKIAEMYGANVEHYLDNNPQAELYVKFDGETNDFLNIPFYLVLNGEIPADVFKDRIVLIGITAPGQDTGPTPVDKSMNLVYVHANIVNQLLNGEKINITGDLIILISMMMMLALTIFITWRFKPIWSIVAVFGFTAVILTVQYLLFSGNNTFYNAVYPLVTLYLTFLVNIAVKTYFETKHKNFITKQFGRYISPDLVKEIAQSDKELPLGGINKELSILFLDIRGFTTLSERLKPEEVVDFLNMMFDMITNKALDNKGTIDKFIGDAAMIIFNAPLDVPNHEYYAVKTAYDIQKGMESVRKDILEKYGVTISVGVGINTGQVVVGNIGSYLRVDYTAIGDNVNTAARIESNTVANQILVSEVTYERTKNYFEYEYIGEKMMKGKTVGIKVYEVKGHIQAP